MMRAVEVIAQKRAGEHHTPEVVRGFIEQYLRDEVPDYQMAAWLMAVCWQGLNDAETQALTMALANSGRRLDFRAVGQPVVDKHSTGGVGDKTTLVLAPMLAASGVAVAKLSGRGLGHTGGTIDKLEAIPGVSTTLSPEAFITAVQQRGLAVAAQSPDLAPGDGRLYALRDVTATVESIPLIASSVMSKKIATGAQVVVLDVKVGNGAFMKDLASARALAQAMVALGREVGLRTVAVLSSMDEPLGNAIGNALEVQEAIATLKGQGPPDLLEICLTLGTEALRAAGVATTEAEARARLRRSIASGEALAQFRALVALLGGDVAAVDVSERLPQAPHQTPVLAERAGYVAGVDALACGHVAMRLGAGRARKGEAIDPAVGLVLHAKTGQRVATGQVLATIHHREPLSVDSDQSTDRPATSSPAATPATSLLDEVRATFHWREAPPTPAPLVLAIIR